MRARPALVLAVLSLLALPRPAAALAMVDFASSDGAFGIQALTIDFGDDLAVCFVDLAHIADAALAVGGRWRGRAIGLPPQCGGDTDLFFDALHLSDLGSRLAADRMAEALGVGV